MCYPKASQTYSEVPAGLLGTKLSTLDRQTATGQSGRAFLYGDAACYTHTTLDVDIFIIK